MYIISKTIKGKEFVYSNRYSILCKNEEQAKMLAEHLNNHNEETIGDFKLKDNEIWWVYEIDKYDTPPYYKVSSTKGKIAIKEYDWWGDLRW